MTVSKKPALADSAHGRSIPTGVRSVPSSRPTVSTLDSGIVASIENKSKASLNPFDGDVEEKRESTEEGANYPNHLNPF